MLTVKPTDPADCTGIYELAPVSGSHILSITAPGFEPASAEVAIALDACDAPRIAPNGPHDGYPGYANTHTVVLQPAAPSP